MRRDARAPGMSCTQRVAYGEVSHEGEGRGLIGTSTQVWRVRDAKNVYTYSIEDADFLATFTCSPAWWNDPIDYVTRTHTPKINF